MEVPGNVGIQQEREGAGLGRWEQGREGGRREGKEGAGKGRREQGKGGSGLNPNSLTRLGAGWAQEQPNRTIGSGHGTAQSTRNTPGYGS